MPGWARHRRGGDSGVGASPPGGKGAKPLNL
jgi:hypothetical protein